MKTEDSKKVQPFLKWAGGKRWLVAQGFPKPKAFSRLVEPFVGSAAVFFSMRPSAAFLSDVNPELINLYSVVRNHHVELQAMLLDHHEAHDPDYYYEMRSKTNLDGVSLAARTLYLNRTCWNGLYRVNKRGQFNVPIGTKKSVVWDGEEFANYAARLRYAELACQDFEVTVDGCRAGDVLFVDPPYTVKHNENGFVKYNEKMFSWEEQIRLAGSLRRAGARGVAILCTNADHPSVIELYREDFDYKSVERHSILAGSSGHRGKTTEALFFMNIA